MSGLPWTPRNGGTCQTGNAGSGQTGIKDALQQLVSLADSTSVSSSVRPGRIRNRTKTELDDKIKKPADGVRKKSPPARKAPARGRYVDEYARPAFQGRV